MRSSLANVLKLIDNAVEEQSVEQQFLSDLKRSIEMSDKKNSRKPSQTYKPSGMNCMRQSYYQITGIEPEVNTSNMLIGICESGTDRHERIQKAVVDMVNNNMDCEYVNVGDYVKAHNLHDIQVVSQQGMETKLFNTNYNMSFLCDGIIKYKGQYYILEIKTESSFKFTSRKDVNPDHYHQATAYSLSLGIDEVIFLYENRDNCDKKTFLFKVTGDMKQELIGYITNCDQYVKTLKVPPRCDNSKACNYCDYKTQCRKDG